MKLNDIKLELTLQTVCATGKLAQAFVEHDIHLGYSDRDREDVFSGKERSCFTTVRIIKPNMLPVGNSGPSAAVGF